MERELRADLEAEAMEQQERGLSPEEAHYAARRALGNTTYLKEEVRQMWGWNTWEIFVQEMRYALRALRKSPGFAATAIVTLAVGIGASTAVFTVVDSLLLRPLAFHDSARLVAAWERPRFLSSDPTGPNPRHVDVWQKRATAFSGLAYLQHASLGLSLGGEHPAMTASVSAAPNLFDVLQVQPLLGRTFLPQDAVEGQDKIAIITYPLWLDLFHGDSAVLGKTIHLGDVSREIVGVLPAGFHFPSASALPPFRRAGQSAPVAPEPAVFIPAAYDLSKFEWNGNYGNWIVVGRLRPDVSIRQAEAQLNTLEVQIQQDPANHGDRRPGALLASVQPLQEAVVGDTRTSLWLLMAAVMGLMLIACLNLANAQLGRALARSREAAVRTALGAARWRMVWNALAESLVLAAIGGSSGILLAYYALDLFRRASPIDLPRLSEIQPNLTVLGFSILLTLAASVISGLLPALRFLATDPQAFLQQGGSRSLGGRQSHRLRTWLIGAQVFGCTALLLITGLFSKSLLYLLTEDKGFETGHVTIAEVRLTIQTYDKAPLRVAFDDAVLDNLRAIPGVESAALISAMPLGGEAWSEFVERLDKPNLEGPIINFRWASPGYFETTRQRLLAGRFLEERDRDLHGVVLSEGEAKALWGSDNPLGAQVRIEGRTFTVVGVVADSRNTSLKSPPVRMAWVHYRDRPPYATFFLVRSPQSVDTLAAGIRQAIWKYAPGATIARIKTMDAQLNDSLSTERFQTSVLLSFGAAALLLAMLGIYGVLNYSVVTRKQEIGVRMALGATRASVYALTFGEAGAPVLAGVLTGLAASLLAGRLIQKLLYGTQVVDAPVILLVTGLFLLSAAAAAFLPARRAASVDPMEALRSE